MTRNPSFEVRLASGFLAAALLLLARPALAGERPVDTDPANFTEGPFTLEAGHAQVEWDSLTWTRTQEAGYRSDELAASGFILRFALSAASELQVFHTGHLTRTVRDEAAGAVTRVSGWGDTLIQFKHNFRGNDGGRIAWGAAVFANPATGDRALCARDASVGGSLLLAATLWASDTRSLTAHTQLWGATGHHTRCAEFRQSLLYSVSLGPRHCLAAELNVARDMTAGSGWITRASLTASHCFRPCLSLDLGLTAGSGGGVRERGVFLSLTHTF